MKEKRVFIKDIIDKKMINREVTIKGWIRSVRKSKKFCFINLNDGTTVKGLQIIADSVLPNYEQVSTMLTGSAVGITGKLVKSGGAGQNVEMQAVNIEIIGAVDESFPLQKKGTSLEFLRTIYHLRPRTNLFGVIFRIRHALSMATHQFFSDRGFYYLNTPIITKQDGEGAGEMFKVSHFDFLNIPQNDSKEVDYNQDYFGCESNLTVTGQLQAECFVHGMNAVYTFGPTFRAENSNTARHLSEFWMVEPEVAFADLDDVAKLAEDYIKHLISYALNECSDEMDFLGQWHRRDKGNKGKDDDHRDVLKHVLNSEFRTITYTDAIHILQESKHKFEFAPEWGLALQTEHEKYLTEKHFEGPVTVIDYPRTCKAFYMKANPDGKTVRAMDVLVPGVGEIIGGSQREDDYEAIRQRLIELEMNEEDYWWYLELRKFGSVPHGGFGLGLERALMYITGMSNIRDVIPFPRYPGHAEF